MKPAGATELGLSLAHLTTEVQSRANVAVVTDEYSAKIQYFLSARPDMAQRRLAGTAARSWRLHHQPDAMALFRYFSTSREAAAPRVRLRIAS